MSPVATALTLDPIQIQSDAGHLLYAEMKFSNADPNARIEASLAETQDLMSLGIAQSAPTNLNFFTRRSGDGTGVIVITSSRPIIDTDLNILLKIKEGDATHIQQVKTKLKRSHASTKQVPMSTNEKSLLPQTIVSEKDIALNLPISAQYAIPAMQTAPTKIATASTSNSSSSAQSPLVISVAPVPTLNSAPTMNSKTVSMQQTVSHSTPISNATTASNLKSYDTPVIAIAQPIVATPAPAKLAQEATQATAKSIEKVQTDTEKTQLDSAEAIQADKAETQVKSSLQKESEVKVPAPAQPAQNAHVIQANESLWKIAARVAAQTHQSIPEVMKQIKSQNEHAFIGGNINRMRQGVAINIAAGTVPPTQKVSKTTAEPRLTAQKQSGKEKYRLNQAEMSLIAENKQDSAQGSAKEKTSQNQTSSELSSKVMTAREKTVKLQHNVSKLSLALQQKDQRIQLLNARLAQLQQQLQKQNHAKKPAH